MELYFHDQKEEIINTLKDLQFVIKNKKGYTSAIKKVRFGRYHVLIKEIKNKTFLELHYDHLLHLLFIGVDYKKKPNLFLQNKMKHALSQKNLKFRLKKVNWFTRRNKALLRGFKVKN